MALFDQLPIYKATYDFSIRILHVVTHFPREYKYTIGQKLQDQALDLIIHIYKVNSAKDKVNLLIEMEEKIQVLYLLLRVSRDMKLMSIETFASIVEMVDAISVQAKGWQKASEKVRESVKSKD